MNMSLAYKEVGDIGAAVRHAKKYVKVTLVEFNLAKDDNCNRGVKSGGVPISTSEELQREVLELNRKREVNEKRIVSEGHIVKDIDKWERDQLKLEDLEKVDFRTL